MKNYRCPYLKKIVLNLINTEGVISIFMYKAKFNFCCTYGVNCFKEKFDNWYAVKINIKGVAFWWLEIDPVSDNRDMKLNQTLVKLHDKFCAIKKSRVLISITQTARRNELKIVVQVD